MVKYIIVPNYCPLYAMSKCFGPTHGPLTKPCPTPVDIIRELLLQTGVEKVHIYEVGYDVKKKTTYGEPVQLNMSNYKIPYEQLICKSDSEYEVGEVVTEEVVTSTVVTPTIITAEAEPIETVVETTDDTATVSEDTSEVAVNDSTSEDEDVENPETIADEVKVEEEEKAVAENQPAPRRLSKSERRALRRQNEQQKQEEAPVTEKVSE
jgi:hypothetical protein